MRDTCDALMEKLPVGTLPKIGNEITENHGIGLICEIGKRMIEVIITKTDLANLARELCEVEALKDNNRWPPSQEFDDMIRKTCPKGCRCFGRKPD